MHDKENLVAEQRLIEATRKNLTGMDGKIGQILKYLGEPIISQSTDLYGSTPWIDVYDLPDDNIPTEDMEMPIKEIGKTLSALKWGINMELSYLKESTVPIKRTEFYTEWVKAERVMTVTYQGYLVYREVEGELDSYLPEIAWESAIDRIYEFCQKVKKESKSEKDFKNLEQSKKDKLSLLAKLREKWGI